MVGLIGCEPVGGKTKGVLELVTHIGEHPTGNTEGENESRGEA